MFNLSNYEREIREAATKHNTSTEEALKQFVYNLTIMRPHFDVFGDAINFRALGQQWNALPSDDRNKQRSEMKTTLAKTATSRTRTIHE